MGGTIAKTAHWGNTMDMRANTAPHIDNCIPHLFDLTKGGETIG